MSNDLTKEEAYELVDEHISSILSKLPTKYWNSLLNDLCECLAEENRNFVQVGIDE